MEANELQTKHLFIDKAGTPNTLTLTLTHQSSTIKHSYHAAEAHGKVNWPTRTETRARTGAGVAGSESSTAD